MKYPNGIVKGNNNLITHSNRGMSLEEDLNATNDYYRQNDIANIHKKPTSITIKKVDYSKNDMICEAYFKTPSTTDYNGVYKGYYIDFEAMKMRFDVVVSFDAPNRQEAFSAAYAEVKEAFPEFEVQAIMDTDFSEQ